MKMTVPADPEAVLSILPRADGSATYSYGGYTVTASANGPIEAQRRDEDPNKAVVDVIVRPAAGVGGTRERHLESILQSTLQQIILVKNFPRCFIQLVLQIKTTPENDYVNTKLAQASLNLPVIPALLQTAVLALLSAAIPLRVTATSTCIAMIRDSGGSRAVVDPSPSDIETAQSTHVLAFSSHDELVLAESEGDFTMQDWHRASTTAQGICCAASKKSGIDMDLDDDKRDGTDLRHFVRATMETKVAADLHWK